MIHVVNSVLECFRSSVVGNVPDVSESTYCLHLQGRSVSWNLLVSCLAYISTIKLNLYVPPKRRVLSMIHGVKTQKIVLFSDRFVRFNEIPFEAAVSYLLNCCYDTIVLYESVAQFTVILKK
jgi:hypothetical protein